MGTIDSPLHRRVALYARVSSDRQVQDQTIASQVEVLQERVRQDGLLLDPELQFIDDGYNGTTLVRPGLERLWVCSIGCTCMRRTAWPARAPIRSCCWRSSSGRG